MPVYSQEISFSQFDSILPISDTYVVANLNDPSDIQQLQTTTYGNAEFLKMWYGFVELENVPHSFFSPVFLRFDLSQIPQNEILSMKLQLYAEGLQLGTSSREIAIFQVNDFDWNDDDLSYSKAPLISEIISTTEISEPGFYFWDIPVVDSAEHLTVAVMFSDLQLNNEEFVIFSSKESSKEDIQPFLIVETLKDNFEISTTTSQVVADAYIVNNFSDLEDLENLRQLNTGNLEFLKIWYTNNNTGFNEIVTTIGFLKFDLSEIPSKNILGAKLNMYPFAMTQADDFHEITLYNVDEKPWKENEINFNTAPGLIEDFTTSEISEINKWASWDVTESIKNSKDSEVTFAVAFHEIVPQDERNVSFYSKNAPNDFQPYLELTYVDENEGGGCLIATAAYGSELAPQVQHLRELRDNHLLQTSYGSVFMTGFNQFYYSFSPTIADLERENPVFRETVRLLITPLILSLSILNYVDLTSDSSVLGYGLGIIALNIGIYFVSPVVGLKITKNLFKKHMVFALNSILTLCAHFFRYSYWAVFLSKCRMPVVGISWLYTGLLKKGIMK